MTRNYFKATVYEPAPVLPGGHAREMPVDVFIFFDAASPIEAAEAYTCARRLERDGARVSVWRHTAGVPTGVPAVGEGIGVAIRREREAKRAA